MEDPFFTIGAASMYDETTDQYIDIGTGKPRLQRDDVLRMIQNQRKADPRPVRPTDITDMEVSMQPGAEDMDQDVLSYLQSQDLGRDNNEPQYG